MLDPSNIPEVSPQETLTRYVTSRNHFRKDSQTVKPDAFIPHPHSELSLTRLLHLSDEEIWSIGNDVATARVPAKVLRGWHKNFKFRHRLCPITPTMRMLLIGL